MRDLKSESIQPEPNVRAPQHPFIQHFFNLNLYFYKTVHSVECMCCFRVTSAGRGRAVERAARAPAAAASGAHREAQGAAHGPRELRLSGAFSSVP